MVRRATVVLAMGVVALTTGCGTMDNIKRPVFHPPGNPDSPVCRVYGGVTGEFAVMTTFPKESISSPVDYVVIPVLGTIDLVLTVVGDTITLPYSIYAEVRRLINPSGTSKPPIDGPGDPVPPPLKSPSVAPPPPPPPPPIPPGAPVSAAPTR